MVSNVVPCIHLSHRCAGVDLHVFGRPSEQLLPLHAAAQTMPLLGPGAPETISAPITEAVPTIPATESPLLQLPFEPDRARGFGLPQLLVDSPPVSTGRSLPSHPSH